MQSRMTTDLALQALLSAVWRRKLKHRVMIHSDQGSQFTGKEWQSFLSKHNLDASMSRRGNCHPSHTYKHALPGNGQRGRRKLLSPAETGTHQAANVHHARRCKAGCVPLSRMLRIRCRAADLRRASKIR